MSWVWLDLRLFTTQFPVQVLLDTRKLREILRRIRLLSANQSSHSICKQSSQTRTQLIIVTDNCSTSCQLELKRTFCIWFGKDYDFILRMIYSMVLYFNVADSEGINDSFSESPSDIEGTYFYNFKCSERFKTLNLN